MAFQDPMIISNTSASTVSFLPLSQLHRICITWSRLLILRQQKARNDSTQQHFYNRCHPFQQQYNGDGVPRWHIITIPPARCRAASMPRAMENVINRVHTVKTDVAASAFSSMELQATRKKIRLICGWVRTNFIKVGLCRNILHPEPVNYPQDDAFQPHPLSF